MQGPLSRFGVNFTNILRAAFTLADPKSVKKLLDLTVFFALLVSASVQAARRMLMKLTPGQIQCLLISLYRFPHCRCQVYQAYYKWLLSRGKKLFSSNLFFNWPFLLVWPFLFRPFFHSTLFSSSYHCSPNSRNLATLTTKTEYFIIRWEKHIFVTFSTNFYYHSISFFFHCFASSFCFECNHDFLS